MTADLSLCRVSFKISTSTIRSQTNCNSKCFRLQIFVIDRYGVGVCSRAAKLFLSRGQCFSRTFISKPQSLLLLIWEMFLCSSINCPFVVFTFHALNNKKQLLQTLTLWFKKDHASIMHQGEHPYPQFTYI